MSTLPWDRCRESVPAGRSHLLIRYRAPPFSWLVNVAMPGHYGHSNNAPDPLVVPRLPTGRLLGKPAFDRCRGRGLASIPHSRAEERDMAADKGIEILGPPADRFDEILTPDALNLIASLQR